MSLLASFTGFLGLFLGKIISLISKEEVKRGGKYFLILQNVFLSIIILSLFFYRLSGITLLGLLIGGLIGFYFRSIYLYLGLGSVVSFLVNSEYGLFINSLIFLFGLIYGSIRRFKLGFMEFFINVGMPNLILFFIPFLLLFFKEYVVSNIGFFLGLSSGGLSAKFLYSKV